ncbi:MAG TPA: cytochrome c [Sphingomicrobium sp.]|nr:cytochrome c [Sphingomicrobium sp.]
MNRILLAISTATLLAACGQGGDGGPALAEANASGVEASEAVENAMANAAPLEREQALALMKQRHDNYERIGDAMKAITQQLRGNSPDLGRVREGAATIANLAPQVPTWFPAGTGPDVGKTEAKAEIWQDREDFDAKARDFNQAAQHFHAAAQGEDVAAIRAAQADLGAACKACHDRYRQKHQ